MDIQQLLSVIWPLIVIQLALQLYALYDLLIVKKKRTKNLNATWWAVIIVVGEIFGAAIYFLAGRSEG